MMRFIYLYFIFFAMSVPAQQTVNRFEQEEYSVTASSGEDLKNGDDFTAPPDDPNGKCCGGNAGDPAPIDDFLPLLVIVGIGLIAWKVRKRGVTL